MGLKREFIDKWMHAERLKSAGPSFKTAAPRKRQAEKAETQAAPAPPLAGSEVQETSAHEDAIESMHAAPPALVPFADMDVWYLSTEMHWTLPGGARTIIVPKGFATDFASVPQSFWAWMPPTGRYGLPAIVHDWLYWDQTLLRRQADDIFDSALADLSVSKWRRYVLYKGVRLFGGRYWRENLTAKAQGEGRILRIFPEDARVTWADWRTRPGVFV